MYSSASPCCLYSDLCEADVEADDALMLYIHAQYTSCIAALVDLWGNTVCGLLL